MRVWELRKQGVLGNRNQVVLDPLYLALVTCSLSSLLRAWVLVLDCFKQGLCSGNGQRIICRGSLSWAL